MNFTDQMIAALGSVLTAAIATMIAWQTSRIRTGRLTRTIEQVMKISELSERLIALEEKVATRPSEDPSRKLLLACQQAVLDDFAKERQMLPRYQTSARSLRSAFLIGLPNHGGIWPAQIVFHSMLILVLLIIARAIYFSEWRWGDTVAVIVAVLVAILLRILIGLLFGKKSSASKA